MHTVSPTDARASRLVECLVSGAVDEDLVQLHGAIVAALELYGVADAVESVLDPALARLNGAAHARASLAMGEQLSVYLG
jgi:hypothetical protein